MSRQPNRDRIDRSRRLRQEIRLTCVRFNEGGESVKPRGNRKRRYKGHAREFQREQAKVFSRLKWSSHSVTRILSLTETEEGSSHELHESHE